MKESTRNRLYKIDRTVGKIIKVGAVLFFVLLIAAAFNTPWKQLLKYLFFGVSAVWLLLIICRHCLSPFVKSEEEEEFEENVDYIIKKYNESKLQPIIEGYSPLRNLTSAQSERVKQLLRELPAHAEKPDQINMASIAQYLTALEQLGKADLEDKRNLRSWVVHVTGKKVPSSSQFNEAIPSQAVTKVNNARKKIERILQ